MKLDTGGAFQWAKRLAGSYAGDTADSLALDKDGNVYNTGTFSATQDFDPGTGTVSLSSEGGSTAFIRKFTPAGELIWARVMGGIGISVAVDGAGNVFTSGRFLDPGDFDPGPSVFELSSAAPPAVFISRLDDDGQFLWAGSLDGAGYDENSGIFPIPPVMSIVRDTFRAWLTMTRASTSISLAVAAPRVRMSSNWVPWHHPLPWRTRALRQPTKS